MSAPLYGWTGKVLHIDLTTREAVAQYPPRALYETWLGGRGLAGYFLRPHCTLEATDPDLPIAIFAGPLGGTDAPTSCRAFMVSRSPLTGGVLDCAVGGNLADHLKRAGWDGLVITGRSTAPCAILIENEDVSIEDTDLWGETCATVFDRMDDDRSTAAIGPAAENGAPIASVVVDRHHAASRGGMGLNWAAKNLKYLSVRGTGAVPVHDEQALAEAREAILRLTAASPALLGQHGFSNHGTAALYDLIDSRRMMPTDNFRKTRFDGAARLNAVAFERTFAPHAHGCAGCHIRCKRVAADGRTMPEYEATAHFTALIGNSDPELVMQANDICGRFGLDPVSAGATLACRREITGEDFSPASLLKELYEMTEGGFLGNGSLDFAESCEQAELSMSVKGLELPAYDPRGAYGLALAYAVNTRGGCHGHAYPLSHEIFRKPVATDRFSFSGKARIIKLAEDQIAAADSLGVCRFTLLGAGLEEYAKAFAAVTGTPLSAQAMLDTGERINYRDRIMNAANGFDACDDDLPPRFFNEEGSSGGGVAIRPLDRQQFLEARANYYRVRGLDEEGRPTAKTTRRLALEMEP
ncbi:aldehyde ferredoxin oxidoreductase [Pseudodesulfovibrio cashew]|uniref:Aldehyde ferredoxin oxidoreductase n=1 Tax=Pseudodesulfovibrio cashew TaxID=2678688 RepID=A0A6I6JLB8_9BACT|nr:aldehyde ferredoxin oxidoreductase C-terminal domain-containing protein [Pseudodesulfovibrio cashew]QGY41778.1 aldehyde ferredoxin oxidoreductase [Pseudodesulfovibrio cashew]